MAIFEGIGRVGDYAHGVHRKKRTDGEPVPVRAIAPNAAAVFAAAHRYYHAANGGEPFEAKG